MVEVIVGQPVPLILQVFDGNNSLKVTAVLHDKYGKEFLRVPMKNSATGLYTDFSIEMPDSELLIAQYVTDKPDQYELAQDVFRAIPKAQPPEKMLVGEVIDKGSWDDSIVGEVQSVDKET